MGQLFVCGLVQIVLCASALPQEPRLSVPRVTVGGKVENLLPEANPFTEFQDRLKAAMETSDAGALQGLYQTNDVSVEQLSGELTRWRPMLAGDVSSRLSIQIQGTIFRDFSLSNPMWKRVAERLTTHKATHLVELMTSKGYWMLPLVEVEGRLFLVPSDKSRDMGLKWEDVQPDRAANESPPVSSNTNSTHQPSMDPMQAFAGTFESAARGDSLFGGRPSTNGAPLFTLTLETNGTYSVFCARVFIVPLIDGGGSVVPGYEFGTWRRGGDRYHPEFVFTATNRTHMAEVFPTHLKVDLRDPDRLTAINTPPSTNLTVGHPWVPLRPPSFYRSSGVPFTLGH